MAPSMLLSQEKKEKAVTDGRVERKITNVTTKDTITEPKTDKVTEELVEPMQGLELEKSVGLPKAPKAASKESKDQDTNKVNDDVLSNLHGHFQKIEVAKTHPAKTNLANPDIRNAAVENVKPVKKNTDAEEDLAYEMIKTHFRSIGSKGEKKGASNKWGFLL
ncbi:hypothetical protein OCU04_012546 [Sclerotinia nivalis]|uniref:Uncharacterized protein n=1 Tax=Sclerotinia nivalis TaxID=352851 RepID=A0A9X0DD22_9HELO|nr:hypothetical protein OCU04_012546 [Sclerotinia nivalis]